MEPSFTFRARFFLRNYSILPTMKTSDPSRWKFRSGRVLPFSLVLCGLAGVIQPLPAQDTPPAPEEAIAEGFTPVEYSIDRYQKLRSRSPFDFELAKPPVVDAVDPYADLVLTGVAGSSSRPTVYLLNTKTQERITILPEGSGKKNQTGFHVISVNRGRTLSATAVKLEKDGVSKEISFDPKALSSMTAGASGGAAPGRPGQPNVPGQPGQPIVRPGNVPGQPPARYQAPQAFIPGQSNRPQGQPAAMVNGQPVGNGGIQLGMQPGAAPAAPGGTDAQQQLNNLLINNGQTAPVQSTVIPGNGGASAQQQQPRRRVVLPTPNP